MIRMVSGLHRVGFPRLCISPQWAPARVAAAHRAPDRVPSRTGTQVEHATVEFPTCSSAIAARVPRGDLPEVMRRVAARPGLAAAFTPASGRCARAEAFPVSLCGAWSRVPATSASSR